MATKNNPGAYDCYAKAAGDEPLFVLLARDKHAPALVELWALLRARDGEREEVLTEAINCAREMEVFRAKSGRPPLASDDALLIERLLMESTAGLEEHPEGFEGACKCQLCKAYP